MDKLESLTDLAKNEGYPGKVFPVQCDMADTGDIRKMFEFIEGNTYYDISFDHLILTTFLIQDIRIWPRWMFVSAMLEWEWQRA